MEVKDSAAPMRENSTSVAERLKFQFSSSPSGVGVVETAVGRFEGGEAYVPVDLPAPGKGVKEEQGDARLRA